MNRELKNGLIHATLAIVLLAPAGYSPGILAFTLAGFGYAAVRETTEEQLKHPTLSLPEAFIDSLTSWKDYLSWSIGGLLIGLGVHFAK